MSPSRCFLCSSTRKKVSLHKFPKNPITRFAWLTFCKLDETVDDVSNLYICSGHFLLSDYIEPNARQLGNRLTLKPGSFPSILKPRNVTSATVKSDLVANRGETDTKSHTLQNSPPMKLNIDVAQVPVPACSIKYETEVTPPRATFSETTYIDDNKSQDFPSPKRAKRKLKLLQRKIREQNATIKSLQQKNRRLSKRIENMEDLVCQLKDSDSISENSAESIVNMSDMKKDPTICKSCFASPNICIKTEKMDEESEINDIIVSLKAESMEVKLEDIKPEYVEVKSEPNEEIYLPPPILNKETHEHIEYKTPENITTEV